MKAIPAILALLLLPPSVASAMQRLDIRPLSGQRIAAKITPQPLSRANKPNALLGQVSQAEATRVQPTPRLRPLSTPRASVENRTQGIRKKHKKKVIIELNDD